MKIYKGQTAVRLILKTNIDLSIYIPSSVSIEYIKPGNDKGTFSAQVLDAPTGTIYIDFDDMHHFDVAGVWTLHAKIVFDDGRIGIGNPIEYKVQSNV